MYTALASVYDLFIDDDHKRRAGYYSRFLPVSEGADLGCGTGSFTLELYRLGYKPYGIDCSEEMLRAAAEKAREAGADLKFILGDAARPLSAHPLGFVTAANDVFNYVKNLDAAFRNVYGILSDGGVFAFDISSEYKLTEVLAGNTFSETKDDVTYIWQNSLEGKKLIIDFTVFSPSGRTYIKTSETQIQYVRSLELIESKLTAAGFDTVKAYDFYKTSRPKPTSQRIMFVATKGKDRRRTH